MNSSRLSEVKASDIPRGNTQKNVNKEILSYLVERFSENDQLRLLDVPCGEGEFLSSAHRFFPRFLLSGGDIAIPKNRENFYFEQVDASKNFPFEEEEPFDIVTSIAGVMMFGNTQNFLEHCFRKLAPGGTIIISNDNILTMRDRLSFLFTGRLRRFKRFYEKNEAITQIVPMQELYRLMMLNDIELKTVVYTSMYLEDFILVPLSLLFYAFDWLSMRTTKSNIAWDNRKKMFPFRSLVCRHYFIVGEKKKN